MLIGASDCPIVFSSNPGITLGNLDLDFFPELTSTSEEWKVWLASRQGILDELIAANDYDPLDLLQRLPVSRLRKNLLKDYVKYNNYDPFALPITYNGDDPFVPFPRNQQQAHHHHGFDNEDDDNDNGSIVRVEAEFPVQQQHADHQHATRSPKRSPSFISCPDGTLFRVLSRKNSQKILVTSFMDLANILLLQGQFCFRRLRQMSEVFTHDAREQALL